MTWPYNTLYSFFVIAISRIKVAKHNCKDPKIPTKFEIILVCNMSENDFKLFFNQNNNSHYFDNLDLLNLYTNTDTVQVHIKLIASILLYKNKEFLMSTMQCFAMLRCQKSSPNISYNTHMRVVLQFYMFQFIILITVKIEKLLYENFSTIR